MYFSFSSPSNQIARLSPATEIKHREKPSQSKSQQGPALGNCDVRLTRFPAQHHPQATNLKSQKNGLMGKKSLI